MCHRASHATAWQCSCGYEFGQDPEKVCELLRNQRTSTRMALIFLLALDAAVLGVVVYGARHGFIVFSGLGFAVLIMWTLRTVHKLAITKASLHQLTKATLPTAKVIEK